MMEAPKRDMEMVGMLCKMVSLHCIYCHDVQAAPHTPEEYVAFLDKHEECGPKAVGGILGAL